MKVSAKAEYASIAMLELAARFGSGEPVRIRDIAQRHGVPSRFLVQILLQLKGAGFVTSTRGAAGGYQLVTPPGEISLGAVMSVIDGADESLASSASPDSIPAKVLQKTWSEVLHVEREMLERVTFADLLEQVKSQGGEMYYI